VFAVQDEITEAIVAAIEPQLYAAENFRAQHKPPRGSSIDEPVGDEREGAATLCRAGER
jgi:hypothetical protein